ncbi:hypothetical protein Tco_0556043 [Tanacetum coccineum]
MFFPNAEAGWHKRIPMEGVDIKELINDDDDDGVEDKEVQDAGKPNIFLMMTCNPNWPEIMENLYEGQTTQDRSDLVTRVFRAKLEYLKHQLFTKHILGIVASIYFQETTRQGDDSYPLYRRRDNGTEVNVRNSVLDNRWVVPYNPTLLMMFNCHINVEVCSSIKSVKYVFKYVYKGHDKQFVNVEKDGDQVVNEINRFQDACYVSPPEAMWQIYGFPLSNIYPSVMSLQVHLPNNQFVRFREDDVLTNIIERERNKRSMLTAFFELNKKDTNARQYFYRDIPRYYTWNKSTRVWKRRKQGKMRGRMVSANPAEGERFYLRVLLQHVKGPTGFDYLYTVDDVLYTTFRRAALERGLIKSDSYIHECLRESSMHELPYALRRLFATILIFCEPGDVRKLRDDHYESLSEDYTLNCTRVERVQNMVLTDISAILQSMGRSISDFDLPNIAADVRPYAFGCRTFFIDGPGGIGKTFLYKALLDIVRSRGLIALATASSGAAANNMTGGRTAHSRFKIPINLSTNSMCNIKKQSGLAKLLCQAKLIIWDEASMAKRQAVEAVDRTMQDITGVKLPFGIKIMVLGGDFRQVLSVVRRGTRAQIVDSSL